MKTKKKYYLFSEMKVVDELQQIAIDNPTKENIKLYEKMQNLFFKHVKDVYDSKGCRRLV